jgi:hypothetical protein
MRALAAGVSVPCLRDSVLAGQRLHQEAEDLPRLLEAGAEMVGAQLRHHVVGIHPRRQLGDEDVHVLAEEHIESALARLLSGGVRIEHEDNLIRITAEDFQVVFGQRGAERRDQPLHAGLVRNDDVEIALDDVDRAGLLDLLLREVEAVEAPALRKDGRFRGVEELGVVVLLERPRAEADRPAAGIVDGKDGTAAEAVVVAALVLPLDHEARRRQDLVVEAGLAAALQEGVPGVHRVSQLVQVARLVVHAAAREKHAGRFAFGRLQEEAAEVFLRPLEGAVYVVAADPFLAAFLVFDGNPRTIGQNADRFRVIHVFVRHHEADGVTALAAAEAFERLALRSDDERGCFFLVKGAKPLVACSGALEGGDVSGDDFVYVDRSLDFQNRLVGDQRHTPLPRGQRRIPITMGKSSEKDHLVIRV